MGKPNRNKAKVYVLMRLYQGNMPLDGYLCQLKSALDSVVKQNYLNKAVVLYFDGPNQQVKDFIIKHYQGRIELHFPNKPTPNKGSAYGCLWLRRKFLNLTLKEENAVAVFLDQDDQLYQNGSLYRIASRFKGVEPQVVISNFVVNEGDKLIKQRTDHSCFLAKQKFGALYDIDPDSEMYVVDSLCMTKTYNRAAVELYSRDLEDLFNNGNAPLLFNNEGKRYTLEEFFIRHRTFEDFIDHMLLLRKDVKVIPNDFETHIYRKHDGSITASRSLAAFMENRLKYLCLIATWYHHLYENECVRVSAAPRKVLKDESAKMLYDYISYKINRINGILKANASKYTNGDSSYIEFAMHPQSDSFIEIACEQLQSNCDKVIGLMKDLDCVKQYHSLPSAIYNFKGKKKASAEKPRAIIPTKKFSSSAKPWINIVVMPIAAFVLFSGVLSLVEFGIQNSSLLDVTQKESFGDLWLDALKKTISIVVAFITALVGIYNTRAEKRHQEERKRQVYNNEFQDLIRHIEAGCKLLIQMVEDLSSSEGNVRPSPIHFTNLKTPENSMLLSLDPILNISSDNIKDMSRVKVNIRNINTVAASLEAYATSPKYKKEEMITMVKWEISRYFGRLAQFRFFQDSGRFPTHEELDLYIDEQALVNKLSLLFMDCRRHKDVERLTRQYLSAYKTDSFERRAVLTIMP